MAKKSKNSYDFSNLKWKDSYTSLILGGIIVVILGLLVASFITKRNPEIATTGEQITINQEGQPPVSGTYKIQKEDSLSTLSKKFYGSEEMWPNIAKLNNIGNPNIIWEGAEIKVPAKDELVKNTTDSNYQVNDGDTLFKIAEKEYGDGSRWQEIAAANNTSYLANGNPLIYTGTTIIIPR